MMLTKKEQRLRRSRQTRIRIATQGVARLTVNRTNLHIYATVISGDGAKVLATASTAEADVRKALGGSGKGGNAAAAAVDRQAHRRKGQGCRRREGRLRPRRFRLPRPRQGAGRCRARSRPAVLSGHGKIQHGKDSGKNAERRPGRRPAREDDRDQPRHQGGEGRPYSRFRRADRGRRRRRPRRHGQGQVQGSAGCRAEGDGRSPPQPDQGVAQERHAAPHGDRPPRRGLRRHDARRPRAPASSPAARCAPCSK